MNKISANCIVVLLTLLVFASCSKNSKNIIPEEIKANFKYNIKNNGEVEFINTSTNALDYSWTFDDGLVSNDVNPNHTFFLNDKFKVKLIAKNQGKSDSLVQEITINNSNKIFDNNSLYDVFSENIKNKTLGKINYDINGKKGVTEPGQLPVVYDITSKRLFLAYWGFLVGNEGFLFQPNGICSQNNYESFYKMQISYDRKEINKNNKSSAIKEVSGKWVLSNLIQNKLSGNYTGRFLDESSGLFYDIKIDLVDISVPFVK